MAAAGAGLAIKSASPVVPAAAAPEPTFVELPEPPSNWKAIAFVGMVVALAIGVVVVIMLTRKEGTEAASSSASGEESVGDEEEEGGDVGGETNETDGDEGASPTSGESVDCKVEEWSSWGECSAPCGGGTQARTRAIKVARSGDGRACPALRETRSCNLQNCPVDCEVGEWGSWGECSASCGGGTQSRSRTVEVESSYGGQDCPALTETRSCNTQRCTTPIVNCQLSPWSDWSQCTKVCDGGTQTRTREILQQASAGGSPCPDSRGLSETRLCNTQECPCFYSDWSPWTQCTETNRVQTRSRQPLPNQPSRCVAQTESIACTAPLRPCSMFSKDLIRSCPRPRCEITSDRYGWVCRDSTGTCTNNICTSISPF
jgi:hypothetical protein